MWASAGYSILVLIFKIDILLDFLVYYYVGAWVLLEAYPRWENEVQLYVEDFIFCTHTYAHACSQALSSVSVSDHVAC